MLVLFKMWPIVQRHGNRVFYFHLICLTFRALVVIATCLLFQMKKETKEILGHEVNLVRYYRDYLEFLDRTAKGETDLKNYEACNLFQRWVLMY